MRLFHRHDWKEKERFYTPPMELSEVKVNSHKVGLKLTFGVTTILYRCNLCTAIKTVEILGSNPNKISVETKIDLSAAGIAQVSERERRDVPHES